MANDILYIGAFIGSVMLSNTIAGKKATYYYLLLVFSGVMVANVGRYKISFKQPEIMTETKGSGYNFSTGSGGGMIDIKDLKDLTIEGSAGGGGGSGGF